MSLAPGPKVTLLDLPAAWWGCLFQHVAAASDGVRSVGVLSLTSKTLHTFSQELEYSYQEINGVSCSSSTAPFWKWLAKQEGRAPALAARIQLTPVFSETQTMAGIELQGWKEPLQLMSTIPQLQLTVSLPKPLSLSGRDRRYIKQWLKEHAALIGKLEAVFVGESAPGWPSLKDLVAFVQPQCKSLAVSCKSHLSPVSPLPVSLA